MTDSNDRYRFSMDTFWISIVIVVKNLTIDIFGCATTTTATSNESLQTATNPQNYIQASVERREKYKIQHTISQHLK